MCPVRAFVPEVEAITRWFALCYRVEIDTMTGYARYERVALPGEGGAGSQDSRLMHGLAACAETQNQMLEDARKARERSKRQEKSKGK